LLVLCGEARAQEWHAVWQPPASNDTAVKQNDTVVNQNDNGVKQVDWEQRMLKRPQQQQRPASTATELPPIQYQPAKTASFDHPTMSAMSMAREPGTLNRPRVRLISEEQPEVIPPGTPMEPVIEGSVFSDEGNHAHGGCTGCGQVGSLF